MRHVDATDPDSVAQPSPWLGLQIMRVLPGIDPVTLGEVLGLARVVPFGRGEPLVNQGDALSVHIVVEGYVSMRRTSPEGHRHSTLILRPGHVTGLEAVSHAADSPHDLIGLSDGFAVALAGQALRTLAARDADLAMRLFDLGLGLAGVVGQRLDQSVFDSAERRVATILLAYEDLLGSTSPVITRAELASLAGTSREMLGLVIRAFEADGAIRREGRAITILDRDLLREHAAWEACGAEHARALTVPPSPARARPASRTTSASAQIALFRRSPETARSRTAGRRPSPVTRAEPRPEVAGTRRP